MRIVCRFARDGRRTGGIDAEDAGGNAQVGQVNEGLVELEDPGDREEQQQPGSHGGDEADVSGPGLLGHGKAGGQNRDEDDVVDAEHDFHRGQRDQRNQGVHGVSSFGKPAIRCGDRNEFWRRRHPRMGRMLVRNGGADGMA